MPGQAGPALVQSSMCTTSALVSVADARAASVVLPDPAGPSTHTSRPAPSVGGAAEHELERRRRRPSCPGSPGVAGAAVGRHRLDDLVAAQQVHDVDVLGDLAGLGVPEPHQLADQQRAPPGRSAASAPRRRPRARSGAGRAAPTGRASGPCRRARGDQPAAGDGGDGRRRAGGRPAARRTPPAAGSKRPVVVEQPRHQQPGPGGDLGDGRVGGGGLDASRSRRRSRTPARRPRAAPRRPRPGARPAARPRPS